MSPIDPLTRALRQAGALIAAGLLIELLTLIWAHPTAFLVFAGLGASLVVIGISRYLLALVTAAR